MLVIHSTRKITPHALRFALLIAASVFLQGCATPGRTTSADPWQGVNRGIYKFNEGLDKAVLKPVAKGYRFVLPNWLRAATGRVLANVSYPSVAVNQLLQGKPKLFFQDTGRFLANSTLGLGGIFDVADRMHMPAHDEDFGQTLAVWGVPSGPYFMLPLLGPSSLRDAPSKISDYFLRPIRYTDLEPLFDYSETVLRIVDTRANLLSSDATLDSAYDKYGIIRDAWVQRREYLIYDGNPPEEALEELEDLEDEPAEPEPAAAEPAAPEPTEPTPAPAEPAEPDPATPAQPAAPKPVPPP